MSQKCGHFKIKVTTRASIYQKRRIVVVLKLCTFFSFLSLSTWCGFIKSHPLIILPAGVCTACWHVGYCSLILRKTGKNKQTTFSMVKANFMAGEKSSSNLSAKSVYMESQCWSLALNQPCIIEEKKPKQTTATKNMNSKRVCLRGINHAKVNMKNTSDPFYFLDCFFKLFFGC